MKRTYSQEHVVAVKHILWTPSMCTQLVKLGSWMLQEVEARDKEQASRRVAEELKQYQREQYEQQIANRNKQAAIREQLQAQMYETQHKRDAATAEVRSGRCVMSAPEQIVILQHHMISGDGGQCYSGPADACGHHLPCATSRLCWCSCIMHWRCTLTAILCRQQE